ncbi:MAG: NIPSNAP family containing protein [Sphingopyxis sp.]|nr:NIPSNAP family containing protein [Sphingopyxis sp.]
MALALATTPSTGSHAASSAAPSVETTTTVVHQLRLYEIFEDNKAAFHARFRDHAMRIMRRYEFKILGIWETHDEGKTKFAYLLEWPNEQAMTERWSRFMADQEWSEIKRTTTADHGRLVGAIESLVFKPTNYTPASIVIQQVTLTVAIDRMLPLSSQNMPRDHFHDA